MRAVREREVWSARADDEHVHRRRLQHERDTTPCGAREVDATSVTEVAEVGRIRIADERSTLVCSRCSP